MTLPSTAVVRENFRKAWGRMSQFWSRLFKYAFLLTALSGIVIVVFIGFSYYSARRSLDTEIDEKRIGSLEYLQLLARKEAELVSDYLETRCRERNRLALFQIGSAKYSTFNENARKAYSEAFELKNALVDYVEKQGPGKVKVDDARKAINQPDFYLSEELIRKVLPPADSKAPPANFEDFLKEPLALGKKYSALFENNKEIFATFGANAQFLDASDIRTIESKLERIKAARAEISKKLTTTDWEELLSRYAVWTAAFVGLNDLPSDAVSSGDNQSGARLVELDCEKVLAASKTAPPPPCTKEGESTPPVSEVAGKNALCGARPASASYSPIGLFNKFWRTYFSLPPIAQTLFVTLFLGAMGALIFNALRLSRVGWWGLQEEPLWGELLVSPLFGALAAFGIFLLGSTGLLLTSDLSGGQSGAPALSAYFIGLLGFVSGLLYDQAFGRVRQFGEGLFAQGKIGVSGVSAEDKELAKLLKDAGASVVAELVLTVGLGSRLSQETQFTLFVPSDAAMGTMSLGEWRELNKLATRQKFEAWLHKHHAAEKLTLGDPKTGTTSRKIKLDEGTELAVIQGQDAKGQDVWKIGKATVIAADKVWSTGIFHILDQEPV